MGQKNYRQIIIFRTQSLKFIERFYMTSWRPCWCTLNKRIWYFLLFGTPTWPLRLLSFVSPGSVWKCSIRFFHYINSFTFWFLKTLSGIVIKKKSVHFVLHFYSSNTIALINFVLKEYRSDNVTKSWVCEILIWL